MFSSQTKRISLIAIALIAGLVFSHYSVAESTSANMQVSAVVKSSCVVTNATMNFGTYDPAGANNDADLQAMGNIQVKCTKGTNASISLSNGQNSQYAQGTTRSMSSVDGKQHLNYELYASSDGQVWNQHNSVNYSAASARPADIKVYGKIPANQQVDDGVYSDTINVVVNF